MKRLNLAAALLVLGAGTSFATTMGFEGVAPVGEIVPQVTPYSEAGFTLTNTGPVNTDSIQDPAADFNNNQTANFA